MNERIRILQLADQAYEESLTDTTKYEVNIPDEFCKKFAELIVRECADLFNDDPKSGTRYTGVACRGLIKHYFGVKE